jgi:hypothetical protein
LIRYLDFAVTRSQQTFPGIGMWIVWNGRAVSTVAPVVVIPPSADYAHKIEKIRKVKQDEPELRRILQKVVASYEDVPLSPEIKQQLTAVVAPFIKEKKPKGRQVKLPVIDWQALQKNVSAMAQIVSLWETNLAILADDEDIFWMMQ